MAQGSFSQLSEIISEILKKKSMGSGGEDVRIWQLWPAAVGPKIQKHTDPVRFRNGELVVVTANAMWNTELTFRSQEIRQKLNEAVGKELVKSIVFRVSGKPL